MQVVTKIARKKNDSFQTPLPIGTTSQFVTVTDDKQTTLKTVLGDVSLLPEDKGISEIIANLEQKTGQGIDLASKDKEGLMSSDDFKKINPQVLSTSTNNLNNIRTIGWYRINYDTVTGSSNIPAEVTTSCFMEVQQTKNGQYFQKLRDTSGTYYERSYIDNIWSQWKKVIPEMVGASETTTGKSGLVPAPEAGKNTRFLRGDGIWTTPNNTWTENSSTKAGYVASPNSAASKVWKTDARGNPGWRDEKDTTYSNMVGASASAAGKAGLVPAPAAGHQNYLLQGNGYWVAPHTTAGGSTSGYLLSSTEHENLTSFRKDGIEFLPPTYAGHGGYIDFHYNGSTADYTARILEAAPGTLKIVGNFDVTGASTVKAVTASGAVTVNGILKAQSAHNAENGHIVPVSSSNSKGITYMFNTSGGKYLAITGRWGKTSGSSTNSITISSSDIRLKKDIKNSNVNGLQLINKIQLREFVWKESKEYQKIGFIADELEKIDPHLSVGKDPYDKDGNPIYKSVDTFYLQGFEIKAIQQLSQQNDELRKEINLLKEEIKELKKK